MSDSMAQRYQYFSTYVLGVCFESDRLDLQNGVTVTAPESVSDAELLRAHADFINHHRNSMAIWTERHSPVRYARLAYTVKRT